MKLAKLLALLLLATVSPSAKAADQVAKSVVKIHVTHREPDFLRPWNKGNAQDGSGTGVILEGQRILTNAHVVLYASQIFVQADQTTERVPAKVKAIAPGIDLAIVEVEKLSFFDDHPPLRLAADIPAVKQTVSVYGYPVGGEQLSVTQGIVSRIECTQIYCFTSGLRIQIDAALNPGNSGGPAVVDGKITGLVHSKLSRGENIGYLIAADEIRMFLADIQNGPYHGKLQLWDTVQGTENEALRAKLGLGKETGVMVCHPFSSAADYPLKKWDLITRIAGQSLDNQGNVKIKEDLRVSYQYLVPKLAKKDRLRLTILRDRKPREVEVPLRTDRNLVIPFLLDKYPRYFICGPMVFMPASQELTTRLAASAWAAPVLMNSQSPLLARNMDHPACPGEEIVTLGYGLLPHKTAKGYALSPFSVLSRLNGTPVRNLAHLVELLRDAKSEFLTIDVAGEGTPLVFRRQEVLQATEEILADEGVRKQYSDDLERVWHPKK
jgi:S1-C subfamily serine protease